MAGRSRKLFINYRRDDSRADAGRLYDRLHVRYPGRVFRDIGSLEPGVEWHEAIEKVLGASDACIVVVGRTWLTVTDATGKRRIDDPRDTCRKEVATAIRNGMRVFPVLVGGAKMPAEEDLPEDLQALTRRNALEISEQDWDEDVEKLAKAIEGALGWTAQKPRPGVSPLAVGIAAAAVAIVAGTVYFLTHKPAPTDQIDVKQQPTTVAQAGSPIATKAPPVESDPAPRTLVPPRQVKVAQDPVGTWKTLVSPQGGDTFIERVEVYPDFSFRASFENNALVSIGRWEPDGDGGIVINNATSFLKPGVKFSCRLLSDNDGGFRGRCQDATQSSDVSSLGGVSQVSLPPNSLPRININGGTMAEKATFIQALAAQPCTCGCQLTLHNCLLTDQTCPLSPGVAQAQWAILLQLTRA